MTYRFQGAQPGVKGYDRTKGVMRIFRMGKRKQAEQRQDLYRSSQSVTVPVGNTGNVIVEDHSIPAVAAVEVPLTTAAVTIVPKSDEEENLPPGV